MKVLITGIDGFVAPFLARELLKENEVCGTYLLEPKNEEGIDHRFMDILDINSVTNVISSLKPEVIYHLAGFSSVADSWHNPEKAKEVNVHGTKNILDAIIKLKIASKVVVVSSADIYGIPKQIPINETHPLQPQSPYGLSRLEQERIISQYKGIDITIARSFSHTGPGQSAKFVCSDFAYRVAAIEKGAADNILMHGSLDVRRDFSDVRDIVRAYILLAKKGKSHEAYNVCSGRAFSIGQILDMLMGMSKATIIKKLDSAKVRKADIPILLGDNSKITKTTGWKPLINFEQTLKDILEYWRLNIPSK